MRGEKVESVKVVVGKGDESRACGKEGEVRRRW